MKKKVIAGGIILMLAVMLALPAMAYQQDIGSYDTTITTTYHIYPTSRYRYADTVMIDYLEESVEYESGNSILLRTGVVNTSNSLVTYEYDILAPKRQNIVVRYSAPVGDYFKLRHKTVIGTDVANVYGTWAPNDKS